MDLIDKIKKIEQHSQGKKEAIESEKAKIMEQLPLWAESSRAIPNEVVRSALFNIKNHKAQRELLKNKELFVIGDGAITYTGEELRQDDQDVWMQILHFFRDQLITDCIEFAPYKVIEQIGWPKRPYYKNKLKDSLDRMAATGLKIYSKRLGTTLNLSLIRKFTCEEKDITLKKWKIWLEPEILQLFGGVYYSKIEWKQRKTLKPFAKWLHSYYASHKEPYPIKIETLKEACGSQVRDLRYFKRDLNDALQQLVSVGFLEYFHITDNKVYVSRNNKSENRKPEIAKIII